MNKNAPFKIPGGKKENVTFTIANLVFYRLQISTLFLQNQSDNPKHVLQMARINLSWKDASVSLI